MIVPISMTVTFVPEAETYLFVLKIPVSTDGDSITAIQPVRIKDVTDVEEWANGLSSALSSAFSEAAGSWGKPADGRRKLVMPEATRLAASNL